MVEHRRFAMQSVLAGLLSLTLWAPGAALAGKSPEKRLAEAIAYAEFRRFHAFLRWRGSYRNAVAVARRMLELASQPPRDAPQSGK